MASGNPKIAERLRVIRAKYSVSQPEFAAKCGVSIRAYQDYEAGKRLPSAEVMLALTELGIDVDWLLTGEGEMCPDEAMPSGAVAPIDEVLMGRVVEGISKTYKEMGARISPRDLGIAAARMASDLIEAYQKPEDRVVALPGLLQQLRRELRSTPTDDASSKRSA